MAWNSATLAVASFIGVTEANINLLSTVFTFHHVLKPLLHLLFDCFYFLLRIR